MTVARTSACTSIDEVNKTWGKLQYMQIGQARALRELIIEHDLKDLLELGFFQGKSTAFMAAVLEELDRGHITAMDLVDALNRTPPITEVLETLGLQHRVTPVYAQRSFTWEMCKLLEQRPSPQFDFCYIDGAHTWDGTGFAFFLVDMLLKPGGWVLFDDLNWSIAKSPSAAKMQKTYARYSEDEKDATPIRKVWELLVPSRGYTKMREIKEFQWGLAQKPL